MSKTTGEMIRQFVSLTGLQKKDAENRPPDSLESLVEKLPARTRLTGLSGKTYWRTLEEIAQTEEFELFVHREFPEQASEFNDPKGRRNFLKIMAASLAFAGLTACTRQPSENIVPYVRQPEGLVPGKALYFATAFSMGGIAQGLLVESHEGRPTKIEGNPDHPGSLGATDIHAQASILTLYDPDRSQTLTKFGEIRAWASFLGELQPKLAELKAKQGAGLRILTETITSPSIANQIKAILTDLPSAKWHQYEPAGRDGARGGAKLAFGQDVNTIYKFDQAEVILSLDSDFLTSGPGSVRYARDFAKKRRPTVDNPKMSRFYAVESTPTSTGAKADHRLPVRASDIEGFARLVAKYSGATLPEPPVPYLSSHIEVVNGLVDDLQKNRGKSIVIAGEYQPPVVHAIAHTMNQALGNVGNTVIYTDPVEANPTDQMQSFKELVQDMDSGAVEMLVILGGNPVYNAPADLPFKSALEKVRFRVHFGMYNDETSARCDWHIPESHYLEAWGDARAYDGTVSIVQPLIEPLYRSKSAQEFLAAFSSTPEATGYDLVKNYWKTQMTGGNFDQAWRKALNDGIVPNTASPVKTVTAKTDWATQPLPTPPSGFQTQTEIIFRPDPNIHDGRFSNNGWLQELAKPLTKLTWDNAALMSPATAQKLGFAPGGNIEAAAEANGKRITINQDKGNLTIPVLVVPGHAENSITVHLGYGRERVGRVGNGQGFNAYKLMTSGSRYFGFASGTTLAGGSYDLFTTQHHFMMEGRAIVRSATLEEYEHNHHFAHEEGEEPDNNMSMFPPFEYNGYKWGMSIDHNACVGCNACVIACQSENNIPVVGKDQVGRGREMQWIRIDQYYSGDPAKPEEMETHFQPMLCQHCEKAPCEVVCPVGATVHDSEGLNNMVYNRCVGTRYCSNNCPYKVRRFNFLLFQDWETPTYKLMRNPDVSVRSRGVMEKCSYCVQRIVSARVEAEKDNNRKIKDGEVVSACAAVCPTEAIVFGDINDKNSRVAKLKEDSRNYAVLGDLNTQPRTTYLAAVRNSNPEIEKKK